MHKLNEVTGSSVLLDDLNFLNQSGRKKYFEQGYLGQDIIVAVIDSGCSKHPEFEDRLLEGVNFCTAGLTSNDSGDDYGHGTHVAGSIAGKNCGVSPKAKILPIKIFNAMGESGDYDLINALKYVKDWRDSKGQPVDVLNMSLSCTAKWLKSIPGMFEEYHNLIKQIVDLGVLIVVAGGNTGVEEELYPAFFNEVVTVGAVDKSKQMALFSTKSSEIDLAQIGVDVISCDYTSDKYRVMSGTSMASPIVSGIASLIACKHKALFKSRMPENELYKMLKMNTIDMGALGVDKESGAGFCTLSPSQDIIMKLTVGKQDIIVNGKSRPNDVPPMIIDNRFVVPIRFVAENTGGEANYDVNTKTATITFRM